MAFLFAYQHFKSSTLGFWFLVLEGLTISLKVLASGHLHLRRIRVLALVKQVTPVNPPHGRLTLHWGSHHQEQQSPDVNPLPGWHVSELPRKTQLPQKLDGTTLYSHKKKESKISLHRDLGSHRASVPCPTADTGLHIPLFVLQVKSPLFSLLGTEIAVGCHVHTR